MTTPEGGEALGTHAAVHERPSSNSAQHNALYAPRGGDQRSKCQGMMFQQLYSTMGETSVPVLPKTEAWRLTSKTRALHYRRKNIRNAIKITQLENFGHPTHKLRERIWRFWSPTVLYNRGTSLIRDLTPLGPCCRPMLRAQQKSWRRGHFLRREATL